MGVIMLFRKPLANHFTPEMRDMLSHAIEQTQGARPAVFGHDDTGAEFCCLANGLQIALDGEGKLILTDTYSGFVDHGPFNNMAEICLLIAYLSG